jgi:hypothetical protein
MWASLHQSPHFLPNCLYLITNRGQGLPFTFTIPRPPFSRRQASPRLTKIWRVRAFEVDIARMLVASVPQFLHLSHSTAAACHPRAQATEVTEAGLAATCECSSATSLSRTRQQVSAFSFSEFWFLICAMLIYCALYSNLPHYFYPLKLEMHHAKDTYLNGEYAIRP